MVKLLWFCSKRGDVIAIGLPEQDDQRVRIPVEPTEACCDDARLTSVQQDDLLFFQPSHQLLKLLALNCHVGSEQLRCQFGIPDL